MHVFLAYHNNISISPVDTGSNNVVAITSKRKSRDWKSKTAIGTGSHYTISAENGLVTTNLQIEVSKTFSEFRPWTGNDIHDFMWDVFTRPYPTATAI